MPSSPATYPNRWPLYVLSFLLLLGLGGCVWKGDRGGSEGISPPYPKGTWRLQPVSMRVYPSTKFIKDGDGSVLEARIELLDSMGDSVKGVGRFRIELLSRGQAGEIGIGKRLYSWDAPVMTLDEQVRYYDPITRTYYFRLELNEDRSATRDTSLHVMFVTVDGKRLITEAALPVDLHTINTQETGGSQ